jgi:hypothetical protein
VTIVVKNLPETVVTWTQKDLAIIIFMFVVIVTQKNSPNARALSEKESGIFMQAVPSQWEGYRFDFCFMMRSVLVFDCFSSQLKRFITAL